MSNKNCVLIDRAALSDIVKGLKGMDVRGYDSNEIRTDIVRYLQQVVANGPAAEIPEEEPCTSEERK